MDGTVQFVQQQEKESFFVPSRRSFQHFHLVSLRFSTRSGRTSDIVSVIVPLHVYLLQTIRPNHLEVASSSMRNRTNYTWPSPPPPFLHPPFPTANQKHLRRNFLQLRWTPSPSQIQYISSPLRLRPRPRRLRLPKPPSNRPTSLTLPPSTQNSLRNLLHVLDRLNNSSEEHPRTRRIRVRRRRRREGRATSREEQQKDERSFIR